MPVEVLVFRADDFFTEFPLVLEHPGDYIKGPEGSPDEVLQAGIDSAPNCDIIVGAAPCGVVPALFITRVFLGAPFEFNEEEFERVFNKLAPSWRSWEETTWKVCPRSFAFCAGIMLGVAGKGRKIFLDGLASFGCALLANQVNPKVRRGLVAVHRGIYRANERILQRLNLHPLSDLRLSSEDGSGALRVLKDLSLL